jgi:hypothetical protein
MLYCTVMQTRVKANTLTAISLTIFSTLCASSSYTNPNGNPGLTAFRPCNPYYELNVVEAVRVSVLGSELLRECLAKLLVLAKFPGKLVLERLAPGVCLLAHICSASPESDRRSGQEILLCGMKMVTFGIRLRAPIYLKMIEFIPEKHVYPYFQGIVSCLNGTVFKLYRKGDYKAILSIVGYVQRFLF